MSAPFSAPHAGGPALAHRALTCILVGWWRGQDLNLRPSGYEPTPCRDISSLLLPCSTDDEATRATVVTTTPVLSRPVRQCTAPFTAPRPLQNLAGVSRWGLRRDAVRRAERGIDTSVGEASRRAVTPRAGTPNLRHSLGTACQRHRDLGRLSAEPRFTSHAQVPLKSPRGLDIHDAHMRLTIDPQGVRILVVDDEAYITDLIAAGLRFVGFEVDTAAEAAMRSPRSRRRAPI